MYVARLGPARTPKCLLEGDAGAFLGDLGQFELPPELLEFQRRLVGPLMRDEVLSCD